MQELVGRLTSIDTSASENVKVISYFDTLVAGGVGLETLVRGAAALTSVVAGVRTPSDVVRVDPDGTRLRDDPEAPAWPGIDATPTVRVWIERSGDARESDPMVLERFAFAVGVLQAGHTAARDDAVQASLDRNRAVGDRLAAAARLRLTGRTVRAVASRPEVVIPGAHSLVVTEQGILRATIVTDSDGSEQHEDLPAAFGAGSWGDPSHLVDSWADAVLAFRISSAMGTSVDAEQWGVLIDVLRVAEDHGSGEHADVTALSQLPARSVEVLDALANAESLRAAASALGMHHSTLQARHHGLLGQLGYDVRTPAGAARYAVARALHALSLSR